MAEFAQLVALGVGFILLFLLGIWAMAKRDVFTTESGNKDTAEERVEQRDELRNENYGVPLRARIGSYSTPAKAALLALLVAVGYGGFILYKLAQTGAPATKYLNTDLAIVTVSVIGIATGFHVRGRYESRIGKLYNIYERAGRPPEVEKIEYFKHESLKDGEDTLIQRLHPTKLLGVFRRHYHIGEHRQLRAGRKPHKDVVTDAIPAGNHAVELDDGIYVNSTRGKPIYMDSPTSPADVRYKSPDNLSAERAAEMREGKRRAEIRRRGAETTSAIKDDVIEDLATMLENEEWQDREDLISLLERYESMQRKHGDTQVIRENGGLSRSAGASSNGGDSRSVVDEVDADNGGENA